MRLLLLFGFSAALFGQPALRTEMRNGVERAMAYHGSTGELVTDENPASPGEPLYVLSAGMSADPKVIVGGRVLDARMMDEERVAFILPGDAGGSFLEISLMSGDDVSNSATLATTAPADSVQLAAAEVQAIGEAVALRIDDPRMAIAIVDRAGRILGIYARPQATQDAMETALSLARTGAFFSNNEAPLSSRTVRSISRENFPEGINNTPAGALFGIENTNRGCNYNTQFVPGKEMPRPAALDGVSPSKGITTIAGGYPLYRNNRIVIGGIGVAGIDQNWAEFAVLDAAATVPEFLPDLKNLPAPRAVFIDGFQLPFAFQFTRPEGTRAASTPGGIWFALPRNGNPAPDEYLVGPRAGSLLSLDDVRGIVQRSLDRANRTRAQIRLPLGQRARFVVGVADVDGSLLAVYRQPDATIFSVDVAITKSRNAVYFSSPNVDPRDLPGVPPGTAVTARTIGFGAQRFFPSGILNSQPGPFRQLYQLDVDNPCTQGRQPPNPNQSGIVFFPGSAALYRNGRIVGGLGISGDGVEQDDYVTAAGVQGFEPPDAIRADQVFIQTPLGPVRLPYFKFPRNPEQ